MGKPIFPPKEYGVSRTPFSFRGEYKTQLDTLQTSKRPPMKDILTVRRGGGKRIGQFCGRTVLGCAKTTFPGCVTLCEILFIFSRNRLYSPEPRIKHAGAFLRESRPHEIALSLPPACATFSTQSRFYQSSRYCTGWNERLPEQSIPRMFLAERRTHLFVIFADRFSEMQTRGV